MNGSCSARALLSGFDAALPAIAWPQCQRIVNARRRALRSSQCPDRLAEMLRCTRMCRRMYGHDRRASPVLRPGQSHSATRYPHSKLSLQPTGDGKSGAAVSRAVDLLRLHWWGARDGSDNPKPLDRDRARFERNQNAFRSESFASDRSRGPRGDCWGIGLTETGGSDLQLGRKLRACRCARCVGYHKTADCRLHDRISMAPRGCVQVAYVDIGDFSLESRSLWPRCAPGSA